MLCRRLTITGRVQNVWYRDWLIEQAKAIGITGWVRNRADGSVEAVVAGSSEMIDAIVAKVRQGRRRRGSRMSWSRRRKPRCSTDSRSGRQPSLVARTTSDV